MRARDVAEVAEAALAWVSEHRDDFALGDDALAECGNVNSTWKPLGELAHVCVTVRQHTEPSTPLHQKACDLLDFAWRQTGQGDLLRQLQRLEPFATYPLEVYAAFASAGMRHDGFEKAAATVTSTRSWQVTEQQPNRRLGILNSERHSGMRPHQGMEAALERTWLGGLPEPWMFEGDAGYTLTHVIFHLTDWGATPHQVPPRVADYLSHWLPPWLDTCLEDERWDLSCELLAVAGSLPGPPDRTMLQDAWTRLSLAQGASGAVPEVGPGRAGRASANEFVTCYHSTLMTAFAAVLTARALLDDTDTAAVAGGRAHAFAQPVRTGPAHQGWSAHRGQGGPRGRGAPR
ncbi:hypothetical protein AB0I94_19845 [Streptomyces sp. NPDC050147]|uniref:DUF6895 family protein n=1 Tax=Streptomyces sp. NPDC050147 TaxID=3155513 RepID=UPI00341AAF8A